MIRTSTVRPTSQSAIALIVTCSSIITASPLIIIAAGHPLPPLFLLTLPIVALTFPRALTQISARLRNLINSLQWYHYLWIICFVSALVFRVRTVNEILINPVDALALYRIVLVAAVGAFLFVRLARSHSMGLAVVFSGLPGFLTIYSTINLVSCLWSVHPMWTLYKSLEFFIDVALLASIAGSMQCLDEMKRLFDLTWTLVGALLLTVWTGIILFPSQALTPSPGVLGFQLQGAFPMVSSNSVGEYGAIIATVALARILGRSSRPVMYFAILATGLATVVLAQTRSALGGLFLATMLVLLLSKRFRLFVTVGTALTVLLLMTGAGSFMLDFLRRGQSQDMIASLTGRVYWWEFGWERYLDHPFIGLGAYAGARFGVLAEFGSTTSSHIHNTWLETLYGTGLVGVVPLLLVFLASWKSILFRSCQAMRRGRPTALLIEAAGVLAILSVRSCFTSGLMWHASLEFLALVCFAQWLKRDSALAASQASRSY